MTNCPPDAPARASTLSDRTIAFIIGGASLLAVAMMAHHPTTTAETMPGLVAEISHKASALKFVHGALIALLGVLLFGFAEYSSRAGTQHPLVRAALTAYAIGVAATIGAALAEGFVATDLILRYADAASGELEYLRHGLRLCWYANQALESVGEVARATAMGLWSCALLRAGRSRILAIYGMLAGAATVLAITLGAPRFDVHATMLALLVGIVWNVALAIQLLRGKA